MVRISDARMSGTAYGTVVLHVAPEARAGGPLAVVQDGDWIELDCDAGRLHLDISDAELAARLAGARPAPRRRRRRRLPQPVRRPRAAGRRGLRLRLPGRLPRRAPCRAFALNRRPTMTHAHAYRGVFPVVPTTFTEDGELDLASQKRCVDFMIDAGSDGLCILANFSEQFVLSDDERELLTRTILEHVAGRVPVIVTTTHFSTHVCVERSRRAQEHGRGDGDGDAAVPRRDASACREAQIHEFYRARCPTRSTIPIMIQDAPVSGTPLSARLPRAHGAARSSTSRYFKIETRRRRDQAARADPPRRRRDRRARGTARRRSRCCADLDAGATGSMTGGGYPGRHPPRSSTPTSPGDREEADRRLPALAAADQLREPAGRPARRQGADEGGRRDRLRGAAPSVAGDASRRRAPG